MSTLIPGAWLRTQAAMTYRLALPCLAIWLVVQCELLRRAQPSARAASASDELGVEVDLDVALQRG